MVAACGDGKRMPDLGADGTFGEGCHACGFQRLGYGYFPRGRRSLVLLAHFARADALRTQAGGSTAPRHRMVLCGFAM